MFSDCMSVYLLTGWKPWPG